MADLGALLGSAGIGGTIGKAIVQLDLDTKKYQGELAAAEAKTTTSTSKLGGTFSKFGGLASTALLGAGAAAVAFGAYSVKAAIEAEDALNKLDNTLQNNQRLSDVSRQSFIDLADSLRDLTGTDDEAILGAEALLGQFKLTGTQVEQLIPLIVDLSAKMGVDLSAAAKAVGKATQGSTGALARYGIILDETAVKGDATGAVLKGLQGTVGGFAEQRAIDEPWRVLSARFEEVAEKLGLALLPLLKNLADAMDALLPFIEGLITGFIQLGHYVVNVTKAIGGFFDAISSGLDPTDEMVQTLGKAAWPFLQTAAGAGKAGHSVKRFGEEATGAAKATKRAAGEFEYADATLDDLADSTKLSERAFDQYFRTINRQSRDLQRVARDLKGEKWVDQDFIDFLSTKGPEWLINFGDKTETQQRRVQTEWEKTNERTKKANENLGNIRTTLDGLDKSNTKHTVEIHYKYVGFDPSKPGMQKSTAR